jgi:hypothetical protein
VHSLYGGPHLRRARIPILPLALLIAGCGIKVNPGGSCPQPLAPVTYTAEVQPFLLANCVRCHSAKATNRQNAPAGVNFDTYDEAQSVGEAADQDILGGRMPPDATLSFDDQCMFDAWVTGNFME